MRVVAKNREGNQGVAILIVTLMLALVTILVVAMFSIAQSESSSANSYTEAIRAEQLSDTAVSLVIRQLQQATRDNGNPKTWASQPGVIRRYDSAEGFRGYKLYSSSDMVVETKEELINDAPPSNWNSRLVQYTDLNRPAIRVDADLKKQFSFFPILDPRTLVDDPATTRNDQVEGFSYEQTRTDGTALGGVVLPGGTEGEDGVVLDALRVPMPVEWIYVLKDGSLGTANSNGDFIPAAGGASATSDNPIRGRIAFWTDDESSKININTASVGTSWSTPYVLHQVANSWSSSQPVTGEIQRYPGHPSQVSLAPVLLPESNTNLLDMIGDGVSEEHESVQTKEALYQILKQVNNDGSKGGSADLSAFTMNNEVTFGDRIYPTLDEFVFSSQMAASGEEGSLAKRVENPLGDILSMSPDDRAEGRNASVVDRSRFFLTAYNRSSETNLFGLPRISMWPIGDDASKTTSYDTLIASLSKVQDAEYFFTRSDSESATADVSLERNEQLLGYLDELSGLTIPEFGGSFAVKYGADGMEQINLQIFDYIRTINLDDEELASVASNEDPNNAGTFFTNYAELITNGVAGTTNAFTQPRGVWENGGNPEDGFMAGTGLPGHGQVTPSRKEGSDYQGLGRFETVSEVSFHVIACADGGDPTQWAEGGVGESNFPPLSDPSVIPPIIRNNWNTEAQQKAGNKLHWNRVLEVDTPLPENTKRIQGALLLEMFSPMAGTVPLSGDYVIEISGLSSVEITSGTVVGGAPLFPDDTVTIMSQRPSGAHTLGNVYGGSSGFKGLMAGRGVEDRMPMDGANSAGDNIPDEDKGLYRWPLITNFIDHDSSLPMEFQSGLIEIRIYANSAYAGGVIGDLDLEGQSPLVQTIQIEFPSTSIDLPSIATLTTPVPLVGQPGLIPQVDGAIDYNKVVNQFAQYWWSFYRNGSAVTSGGGLIPGRFGGLGQGAPFIHTDADVVQSLLPRHGDYRLIVAQAVVPASEFIPHRNYGANPYAHNLIGGINTSSVFEFDYAVDETESLAPGTLQNPVRAPDFPILPESLEPAHAHGDFDHGIGDLADGAYLNMIDNGTAAAGGAVSYFDRPTISTSNDRVMDGIWDPAKLVPSPGVLGSLPTGVVSNTPWQTLLFRSQNWTGHKGDETPKDHLLMDFFRMPKSPPYSDNNSSLGKVNLNYQILPFTHIRRATALHGLLESEVLSTLPNEAAQEHLVNIDGLSSSVEAEANTLTEKEWFRKVDIDATLSQFDFRFEQGDIFVTGSEICDVHLVPETTGSNGLAGATQGEVHTFMQGFWGDHAATGENARERSYANLYGMVTTRSNSYRVHVIAQTLLTPPSRPGRFDEARDRITAEYRGETELERYLDTDRTDFPDFAIQDALGTSETLDSFHNIRVRSSRRFSP